MTDQSRPPAFSPVAPQPPVKKSKWYTSKCFIGVVVFFVGAGIGAAGSRGAAEELEVAKGQISTLDGDLTGARQEISDLTAEVNNAEALLDQAQDRADRAEVEARETVRAEFSARKAELDAREQDLSSTAKALDKRERKVSGMERSWEANTIPGDGIFLVGSDIDPGLYKADSAPSGSCYYARLSGTGGFDDIIENNNVSGPLAIDVASSDVALELSGCGEFHKVG